MSRLVYRSRKVLDLTWTIVIKILTWIIKYLPWLIHLEIPGECSDVFMHPN